MGILKLLLKTKRYRNLFPSEFSAGVWKYQLAVLLMRNRIFRDVTISGGSLSNRRKRVFFGLLKRLRYFRAMEDEMIDYGFEEDSVRRELVL